MNRTATRPKVLPARTAPARSLLAFAIALVAALCCAPLTAAAASPDDARALAQSLFDRPAGRDLTTVVRMELTEKGRPPRTRELISYRLAKGRGESATLIRFLEPKDIAGTGLLSVTSADGSNEQSLYLPAMDRVRRIASDRKGGRFVGSDIYYEDLQERLPSKDRHRLLGKEEIGATTLTVLESVPVDPAESVYKKRVSLVDPQTLLVHRIDYFERDESTPTKRWEMLASKRIQGYWTVTDSRLTDLGTGHSTRLVVDGVKYDRKLPAQLFTPKALADETLEAEYRP